MSTDTSVTYRAGHPEFARTNYTTGSTFMVGEHRDEAGQRELAAAIVAHARATIDALGTTAWDYAPVLPLVPSAGRDYSIVRERIAEATSWTTYIGRLTHAISSVATFAVNAVWLAAEGAGLSEPEANALAYAERAWQEAQA